MNEVKEIIEDFGRNFEAFKGENDRRLEALENIAGRGGHGGSSSRGDGVSVSAVAKEHQEKLLGWVRTG